MSDIEDQIQKNENDIESLKSYNTDLNIALIKLIETVNQSIKSTELFKEEMKEFKESVNQSINSTEVFKDEMKEFKDEMRQSSKDMNLKWGELANKMGTVIEDLIAPNVPRAILSSFKMEVIQSSIRIKKKIKLLKLEIEIDVLAVTENVVFLIESKTSVNREKIDYFENKVLSGKFVKLFPEYENYKIIQIISSLSISEELRQYLFSKNMYPMVMKDNLMEIITS